MSVAAIFPGQGSQAIGMGQYLYDNFKITKELFEEASDTLSLDFKKLCFAGPEEKLQLTANTQPALLLVSICSYRTLRSLTDTPVQLAAGHSIGEYAAVVASGALSFNDQETG